MLAKLTSDTIARLTELTVDTSTQAAVPLVYKIWGEHTVQRCIYASVKTIKGDAAQAAFSAAGDGIVWAIADTGIDRRHPHFQTHRTLELPYGMMHRAFTGSFASDADAEHAALQDKDGHGTHVAGIVAGKTEPATTKGKVQPLLVQRQELKADGASEEIEDPYDKPILGIAPLCKLMSLKVLDTSADGNVGPILAAIGYIQKINDYGRDLKIHGLNLSLGYPFDPAWFAAGRSPLCSEVNRLVRSGVVVVIAAGNSGMTLVNSYGAASAWSAQGGTIADPGNADLAITVGSVHRDQPHTYGVSFFSGKGPTGDGRMKPDLVAPGERIVSCALPPAAGKAGALFKEDSGTSMAAPHVSAAIAAFLSVRREFIGRTKEVKDIMISSATDLGRRPEFQGAGLVDLMRALQSV